VFEARTFASAKSSTCLEVGGRAGSRWGGRCAGGCRGSRGLTVSGGSRAGGARAGGVAREGHSARLPPLGSAAERIRGERPRAREPRRGPARSAGARGVAG